MAPFVGRVSPGIFSSVQYVLQNDVNPHPALLLEVVDVTRPENGACEFSSDGYVRYTPAPYFVGTDRCRYLACLEHTAACDQATLVVDVLEVQIAGDDEVDTLVNASVLVNVLENDDHPGAVGDPDAPLAVTGIARPPEHGACAVLGDLVVYTPTAGFIGMDRCTYTVCAGDDACDEGTLTIHVLPSRPVAEDDEAVTTPNVPVDVDVTANDGQAEGVPLRVVGIAEQPEHGICEIANGAVRFTSEPDYTGTDQCTYTVCVGDTPSCNEGTLTVEVTTAPTAGPSLSPVPLPTATPTAVPTVPAPTTEPSSSPVVEQVTKAPAAGLTPSPVAIATAKPTSLSTRQPASQPSGKPTPLEILAPTHKPLWGNTRPFAIGQLRTSILITISVEFRLDHLIYFPFASR